MISLEHLLLQPEVLTANFACDVQQCKGACCTVKGGLGAPLLPEEHQQLLDAVEPAKQYLSDASIRHLTHHSPIQGQPGAEFVGCIDDADCVFVTYEHSVALCAIEKAYHAGQTPFRKPLSCQLFPIRVANFGGPYLYYDKFDECAPAIEHGNANGISLVESSRAALVRAYGEATAKSIAEARADYLLDLEGGLP
jgi:Fe-S-cluster containining protein